MPISTRPGDVLIVRAIALTVVGTPQIHQLWTDDDIIAFPKTRGQVSRITLASTTPIEAFISDSNGNQLLTAHLRTDYELWEMLDPLTMDAPDTRIDLVLNNGAPTILFINWIVCCIP